MRSNPKAIASLALTLSVTAFASPAESWRPLFNGSDFSGWRTWLAQPHASTEVAGLKRDASGAYLEALGYSNDPLQVFTVVEVDGQAAIRISGQVFGMILSDESFGDYHLRLRFKWGEKKWAPRLGRVRDSGLLYGCYGEPGAVGGVWPKCLELQIQEHDCGDLYAVLAKITVPARPVTIDDQQRSIFDPKGDATEFFPGGAAGNRCLKRADYEKPTGEWNTIELICLGGNSIHVVNGHVVMRLRNARQRTGETWSPLDSGPVALQSEGAEVFYRDIEIRAISDIPTAYAED